MESRANIALVDVEAPASPLAVCLLCKTPSLLTERAVADGGTWRCAVCGQPWDAVRLSTAAAYKVWAATLRPRT